MFFTMFCIRKFPRACTTTVVRSYYAIKYDLLNAYQNGFGNVRIPAKYQVDSSLPCFASIKNVNGFYLGTHVYNIRQQFKKGLLPSHDVNKLKVLGFAFDIYEENRRILLLAFKTYIDKFKSTRIVIHFKIAKDDESWPKETRGIALGKVLSGIRYGRDYNKQFVDEVRALGIDVENVNNSPDFELYFEALKTFNKIHGHCKPTSVFVVPEGVVRYNEEAWGIPLGKWLMTVRSGGSFSEHKQRLVDLGVDFNIRAKVTFEVIYSSLVSYKNIHGHVNVPAKFVVPEGDDRYVKQTWGYKLGACLKNVRYRGDYAEHADRLIELGVKIKQTKNTSISLIDVVV